MRLFPNLLQKKSVILILLILFIVFMFYNSNWLGRLVYPIHYKDEIQASSVKYDVNPFLIAAIMKVESNYKTDMISHKGAVGLMQLMPETAQWIIDQAKLELISWEMLKDPAMNIEAGSWYLHMLNERFEENDATVIAAYNAGPGNVQKWIDEGTWNGKKASLSQIPYGETRHYVQRVIYYLEKYEQFYADTGI